MGTAVRETLAKADALITENQESVRNTIKNLETFTAALARNGDKIDKLVDNSTKLIDTSTQTMSSFNELAVSLKKDTSQLAENLDKRTAEITEGVTKLTDTATKHVNVVGNDMHRAIINIDKSITDLAKNPQRILFGGGNDKK
jgi:phospholipid/cholesterol/gamma-HCH transport system substrate-binding protein